jgi:hypothetical protein
MGQAGDRWLCLGVLCLKSQIPSTKLQINPPAITRHERAGIKFQYSMTKTFHEETLFEFSNFGHWTLFDICNFNNSINFQKSKSPLGIIKA